MFACNYKFHWVLGIHGHVDYKTSWAAQGISACLVRSGHQALRWPEQWRSGAIHQENKTMTNSVGASGDAEVPGLGWYHLHQASTLSDRAHACSLKQWWLSLLDGFHGKRLVCSRKQKVNADSESQTPKTDNEWPNELILLRGGHAEAWTRFWILLNATER